METKENPTDDTQVDASQLNATTGDEAESVVDSLTLAEINELTGKDYKNRDSALKSITDMSKQAGKAADLEGKLREALEQPKEDAVAATPDSEVESLKQTVVSLQEDSFFAQNPSHAENRDLLKALAKAENTSLIDAVNLPAYKNVMDKLESTPQQRTVAASNNRVAQPSNTDFNPAEHAGDATALAKYVNDKFITNK